MIGDFNTNVLEAAQRPSLQNEVKKVSWKNALGGSRRNESIDRSVEFSTIRSVEFNMEALKAEQWPELPCEVVDFTSKNEREVDLKLATERSVELSVSESVFERDWKEAVKRSKREIGGVWRFWVKNDRKTRAVATKNVTWVDDVQSPDGENVEKNEGTVKGQQGGQWTTIEKKGSRMTKNERGEEKSTIGGKTAENAFSVLEELAKEDAEREEEERRQRVAPASKTKNKVKNGSSRTSTWEGEAPTPAR